MIADEVDGPEYIPHYLWKLLIDERYQRANDANEGPRPNPSS